MGEVGGEGLVEVVEGVVVREVGAGGVLAVGVEVGGERDVGVG